MINEFEFYHGAVLTRLLHDFGSNIGLTVYSTPSNSSYVVGGRAGIYIKYSKKRMTPWRFTFKEEHQSEIKEMKKNLGEVFTILVCHNDGIVILSYEELKKLLDDTYERYEWVSLERNRGQEYRVNGKDGNLKYKIAKNEFPSKIVKYLASTSSNPT